MASKPGPDFVHVYRGVYGDSTKRHITEEQLQEYVKTVPARLSAAQRHPDNRYPGYSRDLQALLGISLWVFGGYRDYPAWVRGHEQDYEFELLAQLMRSLNSFESDKGNWPARVRFCRMSAQRDLARRLHKEGELRRAVENLFNLAEGMHLIPQSEQIFSTEQTALEHT